MYDRIQQRGSYPESKAIVVMRNLSGALSYLQDKRIVHRDLKPENLLLRSKEDDTDLVIADFGLASLLPSNGSMLKQNCGTPGFVAPEVLRNEGYESKVDVFSLGAVLFLMLSGKLCFPGKTPD